MPDDPHAEAVPDDGPADPAGPSATGASGRRTFLARLPRPRPVAVALVVLLLVVGVRAVLATDGPSGSDSSDSDAAAVGPTTVPSLITAGLRVEPADRHVVSTAAEQDVSAGVLSRRIPLVGDGVLTPVAGPPGSPVPPGPQHLRVRVETEGGLPIDAGRFADFALEVLNDPRGWGGRGYTFERTDGPDAAFELILASPSTSEQMCEPLGTFGTMSCRTGSRVILTWYRWVVGIPEYGTALTDYRRYVVNHEVGHFLGFDHVFCPGPGLPAPLMMQQTKGLDGCLPNPWP